MANGHGGARAGAGRKPKAEKYIATINEAERRIADRLPELIDHLFDLACGVFCEEADARRVYQERPDRAALVYLVDRVMGKPKELVEHSGEIEGATASVVVLMPDNGRGDRPRTEHDDPPSAGTPE
jgi:hypothetical protein